MTLIIIILFVYGVILWISGSSEITNELRKSLGPQDIELIYYDLQFRRLIGLLLILLSSGYFVMEVAQW
jgi:hypothetical protein